MQIIKDVFLTACGHSFCYMCIITHLTIKSDCPCCSQHLINNQLYPNFLLDKWVNINKGDISDAEYLYSVMEVIADTKEHFTLLKKTSARHLSKTASPLDQFREALEKGCDVSIKEVDDLLTLLAESKRKMEEEEAERNMPILLDFLHCLKKQKVDELNEVQTELQYIKEDVNAVERHITDLYRARDRHSVKLRMLGDDPRTRNAWPLVKNYSGLNSNSLSIRGL